MAEPRDVEPGEREILEHSLKGCRDWVYRNYFVADPTTEDGLVCLSLVEQGLMVKAGSVPGVPTGVAIGEAP